MGYDGKPIGPDLTIVTVVLQYGVFPSVSNGTRYVGWSNPSIGILRTGEVADFLVNPVLKSRNFLDYLVICGATFFEYGHH